MQSFPIKTIKMTRISVRGTGYVVTKSSVGEMSVDSSELNGRELIEHLEQINEKACVSEVINSGYMSSVIKPEHLIWVQREHKSQSTAVLDLITPFPQVTQGNFGCLLLTLGWSPEGAEFVFDYNWGQDGGARHHFLIIWRKKCLVPKQVMLTSPRYETLLRRI